LTWSPNQQSHPGNVNIVTSIVPIIVMEYKMTTMMVVYLMHSRVTHGLLKAHLVADCRYRIANTNGCRAVKLYKELVKLSSGKDR
jgi:hypothetical protein